MENKKDCPPSSLLVDFVQGKLAEPDLSEYSMHLEECEACQKKAKTISPYDALVETLRGDAPIADRIARDVPRLLIESLKQIPRGESTVGLGGERLSHGAGDYAAVHFDFLAPAQQANEIGRLGEYRILQLLGMGGMGAVFLAEDPKLDRRVALKVMLPRIAANPTAKDRFLREARAAARLKSDHIVTIYQVDEANGVPYLAMELLEGQSLEDLVRSAIQLNTRDIIQIGSDIARGLAVAHAKGLVHRDIKPGNLWVEGSLGTDARIKILDFGLARAAEDESRMTQSGAILGTPAYMAPEQAHGDKHVDARADLFSLGCVLYHLSAGDVPFKSETTMGTLMAIVLKDPISLTRQNSKIPPELAELIMQLLEKDPSRRPQSASDVVSRLAAIERQLATSDHDASHSIEQTIAGGFPSTLDRKSGIKQAAGTAATKRTSTKKGRPRVLWCVGLMFAAFAGLAGLVLFWQTPDGQVVRVESNDPSIQISFNDSELKVVGAHTEPIVLKSGKTGLTIVKKSANGDEFQFDTDKLVVNRGDKIVLRIEVVDGKIQLVQAGKGVLDSKPLPLPDEAGEWEKLVATMQPADQVAAVAKRLKSLNPELDDTSLSHRIEGGAVVSFDIGDASKVKELSPLRGLPNLKQLYIDGRFVSAPDISVLRGMKLVSFASNACPFRDLSPLAEMPLKRLNLWGCAVTDLSPLRGMELVETNLGHSPVKDISVLKGMPLEFVCLNISSVEDLSPLAGAPLKRLFAANIKAKDLKPVANAPIEWLCIDGTPIEDMTPLLTMPLQFVEMDNPEQHAELLRKISTLKTINHRPVAEVLGDTLASSDVDRRAAEWAISIGGSVQVNGLGDDIKSVAGLPQDRFSLTEVKLHGNARVTDEGLACLADVRELTSLKIDKTQVSDAGLRHLKYVHRLKWLDISGTNVSDDCLALLRNCEALETFLLDSTPITNEGLRHIKDLKQIKWLALGKTKITDEGLALIEDFGGLTLLSLYGTQVTDAGLARLKSFPKLENLDLSLTTVSDVGVSHLGALKNLATLHLQSPNITDKGLTYLRDLKALTFLDLSTTKVTPSGLNEFHAAVPKCKVHHDGGIIEPTQ